MSEQPQDLCDSYRAEGLWTDRLLTDFLETAGEQGLAKYKWPEYLEIMETLPLSPAGKVKRPTLKEIVLDRMPSTDTAHG